MKRATATRPSGSTGTTRTSTSTSLSHALPPVQKKPRTTGGEGKTEGPRRGVEVTKEKGKSQGGGREKDEAAFMASLLADLDDDFWNAPPASSPQKSPVKKKRAGAGVGGGGTVPCAAAGTLFSFPTSPSTSTFANASETSTTASFRTQVTPVKKGKAATTTTNGNSKAVAHPHLPSKAQAHQAEPFASKKPPSSSSFSSWASRSSSLPLSSSTSTVTSASSGETNSLSKSTSTTSTSSQFDLQSFLEGAEDWDLSDGGLSPAKSPVVKPVVVQPLPQLVLTKAKTVTPHACGLHCAPRAGTIGEKTESNRGNRSFMEKEEKYTPDPCTRCVVLSVEDVCVDGGEEGKARKRWEKRVRARAPLPSADQPRSSSQKEVEVEVILRDGWYETDIRVDDIFNIIGKFMPPLGSHTISTDMPTIQLSFTSAANKHDQNNNLLILHPDVLLTATALSSAAQCARKPVISGLVRQSASGVLGLAGDNKASPAMVYGNILHEVMDKCLIANRWGNLGSDNTGNGENEDAKWMNKCIDEAIRGSLGEIVRLGLEEAEVRREIRERARGFGVFARRYLGGVPKEDGILNNTRMLAHDAPSRLAITHLLDIEEDIWSPAYGIKGKIDAVVRGIIDDPVPAQQTLYNSGLRRNVLPTTQTQRTQRHTPLPLELKTGRVQTGMDHRAQTMLYTLLLSERYNVDVRDGLLFYSRLRDNDDGSDKLVGEDMVRVPRGSNEIRGLIGLRNQLAAYLWRRIRKRKDITDVITGNEEGSQNRQQDSHIEEEERDIEENFLPPPIDDEWTCKRCYVLDTCLLFRKTHPPLPPSNQTQNQKLVPALPPSGRLRQMFDAHTAHLTPARVTFFRQWEALLALEERDMVKFKRELWVLGAREREKRGRCLGGMKVIGVGSAPIGDGASQMEAEDEDGDEGKGGKEGKIYRFVYTFEKDLDFLADQNDVDGTGPDSDNLSLQNTHLVKGDPITVSLMNPRQVLALARGYILDFQRAPSDASSLYSDDEEDKYDVDINLNDDDDADMILNLGMHINFESDDEMDEHSRRKRQLERERERQRRRANKKPRGRVVVGVDHSLDSWLDGGVSSGTPLGVSLGSFNFSEDQRSKPTYPSSSPRARRAIFRIDKDELFGGMSRVRENLASLFYASGPVSLPPSEKNGNGQITTTMGRGHKKLLELVVDLRKPVFDDGWDCDDVEVEGEGENLELHSAEERDRKAVAAKESIPAESAETEKEDNQSAPPNQSQKEQQNLNPAQTQAIQRALSARDYALILGMPGTGKTCVIASLVRELVFGYSSLSPPLGQGIRRRKPKTVLISSYTHSAVDSILRKLVENGEWEGKGAIVRLGNLEKIHPEVRKFSPAFSKGKTDMTVDELETTYMNASVVATTCLGLDHPLFSRRRFDYCILDEASQITLPTCLGPLRFADVFVLVGDHHQLPPLVKNPLARPPLPVDSHTPLTIEALTSTPSLTTSLFLLLSTAHPESVVELTEQYRMNEDIMTISNELVYSGRMKCASGEGELVLGLNKRIEEDDFLKVAHRAAGALKEGQHEQGGDATMYKQCSGVEGGDDCWLERLCDDRTKAIFINTDALPSAHESRVGDLVQNLGEARLVTQFVQTLKMKGVHGSRVGVVTLYRQQVKVLEGLLNGDRTSKADEDGDVVEVMTADKSQGRDKDCVVVSLVRSNDSGRIGDLVKDWRRINVSFTRARCKLVIFGSRQTLEREPMLSRFFELMDQKGWVLDLKEGAEKVHDGVLWAWPGDMGGGQCGKGDCDGNASTVGRNLKRSRRREEDGDGLDLTGKAAIRCGNGKENDLPGSKWSEEKGSMAMGKVMLSRPTKRVKLEDNLKADALLSGRPVLRDLVVGGE